MPSFRASCATANYSVPANRSILLGTIRPAVTPMWMRIQVRKIAKYISKGTVMSVPSTTRLYFHRDRLLGICGLLCGRLLPTLKPPAVDLTGKTAIITGGNSGIGFRIAVDLARQGATVYLACRNVAKAEGALSQIVADVPASKGRVKSLTLDTSSLASVRACAEVWTSLNTKIDLFFHNAGIGTVPAGQELSVDGFPMFYAANFLGSFLLTHLLERSLSADARIILTSSWGQYNSRFSSDFSLDSITERSEPGYHVPKAIFKAGKTPADEVPYSQTKGMQVIFAKSLQNHFDRKAAEAGVESRRVVHAFSPGLTFTPMTAKIMVSALAVDVCQGAATGVWLGSTDDDDVIGKDKGGGYWDRMTRRVSSVDMMSQEMVERFWMRWEADAGVEWR